ncbi:hypothetical protein BKA70DRAFT_1430607 [Coprinopsis sp. MPI-PUGE-AT-0042]|nr:hypothetical protein BKA70DRAFT_1430607 [Coprinopsis sp. MPI-PUGE-AT-0042]
MSLSSNSKVLSATTFKADSISLDPQQAKRDRNARLGAAEILLLSVGDENLKEALRKAFVEYEQMLDDHRSDNPSILGSRAGLSGLQKWSPAPEMDSLADANACLRTGLRAVESNLATMRRGIITSDSDRTSLEVAVDKAIHTTQQTLLEKRFGLFRPEGPISFNL